MMVTLLMDSCTMATLSQTRDAFQQRLLTFLYRGSASSSLVLKGGAAMRVLTESARFTQDLDFDHDPHTVRTAISRAVHGSGLVGVTISESRQTDTVARWKISGQTSAGENLHLAVEVSRRQTPDPNHVLKIPVQIADRTLPRVYVSVYDEQALADNKLALTDERRTAPRDVYDLELLLARGVAPSAAAVENLGGQATLLKRVADKLELMNWGLFREEVLPTLPAEIYSHIDEREYLAMKQQLLQMLKRSLTKPASDADFP
jgi:predicted nucleotidyltransferase component of viral defense system